MRKKIDIDEVTLSKLKLLAAFENNNVKGLVEEAVSRFVAEKEKQIFYDLNQEEKEDLGLLLLMQQADSSDFVSREAVMDILDEE
ncbi:MAG: hypothetical protein PHW92_03125 [Lutibacter sp.]|nr:hypothetical protein [Lutibacter sp.]